MDIRLLAIAMLCAGWAAAAVAQNAASAAPAAPAAAPGAAPTAAEKSAMERAQREADGPRRRILEAAKVKGTVKVADPAPAAAPAPTPVAATAAAKDEAPPERMLVTQPAAVERVALPAGNVSQVPMIGKVELVPAAQPLSVLPERTVAPLGPPKLLSKVDPELPGRLQRRLSQRPFEVVADLTLETDGSVSDVNVRVSGDEGFSEIVRTALKQWRYEPQPETRLHTVRLLFSQPN